MIRNARKLGAASLPRNSPVPSMYWGTPANGPDPSAYVGCKTLVDRREAITDLVRLDKSGPLMQALKVK